MYDNAYKDVFSPLDRNAAVQCKDRREELYTVNIIYWIDLEVLIYRMPKIERQLTMYLLTLN